MPQVERLRWYRSLDPGSLNSNNINITPVVLAFWISDDGNNNEKGGTKLSTQGFIEEDVELLRIKLRNIGLHNITIQNTQGKLFQ